MTKIKICGLRKIGDVMAAAEAGADFLGIVFEPNSRRCVDVEDAKYLVESVKKQEMDSNPLWVGVFANQSINEVNQILDYCDIDLAQLSGRESPEYCSKALKPVIKVLHVGEESSGIGTSLSLRKNLELYQSYGCYCMLDTFKEGILGGTGQVFNWDIAKELAKDYPLFIAGGLTPDNVEQAMIQINPWGLDVSSGVEMQGHKDPYKIVQFITTIRSTDQKLENTNIS